MPIVEDLHGVLRRPLRIQNEADCFTASEARDGMGKEYRVVFDVILASGAGAGIAIDQVAHHGPNNSAGDWGHSPLPYPTENEMPGDECYCGKRGCLETWVGCLAG